MASPQRPFNHEQTGSPLITDEGHTIRVGTASWTDPTMTSGGVFYPRGTSTAEARLRYYATQFSVVEVDSTYYSLPDATIAQLWAEQTPPSFQFHVKAHALMTGQPTEVAHLPQGLVSELPAKLRPQSKIYAKDLALELTDAVWDNSSTPSHRCATPTSLAASCSSIRAGFCRRRRTRICSPNPHYAWPAIRPRLNCATASGSGTLAPERAHWTCCANSP